MMNSAFLSILFSTMRNEKNKVYAEGIIVTNVSADILRSS